MMVFDRPELSTIFFDGSHPQITRDMNSTKTMMHMSDMRAAHTLKLRSLGFSQSSALRVKRKICVVFTNSGIVMDMHEEDMHVVQGAHRVRVCQTLAVPCQQSGGAAAHI